MSEISVSITICTHNPDPALLQACLEAAARMCGADQTTQMEIILVDNRSSPPLTQHPWLRVWLARTPAAKLVREETLGLSHARARAFREARGNLIICFDDDNLPDENYLEQAVRAATDYPQVGVWGPGHITVVWMPGADATVIARHAGEFQQHHQDTVTYGLDFPRPATMPYGTGMFLRREIADAYADRVESSTFLTTGRRGDTLASAEDNQICWLAMQLGWAIGRHPALRMRHLIPARRAQMRYIARLAYGKACSYAPALREALPDHFNVPVPSTAKLCTRILGRVMKWLCNPRQQSLAYLLARQLGYAVGAWRAHGRMPPRWVRNLTRWLYD